MSKEFKRTEHPDIIVHWTGKDIDIEDPEFSKTLPVDWRKHCLRPIQQPSLIKTPKLIEAHVKRLRDILKYGLWMTGEKSRKEIFNKTENKGYSRNDGRAFDSHKVSRISFTELKLSEARQHAYEYGRLGIGVKRMFLYNRAGQPLVYVGPMQKKSADVYQISGYETELQKPNWVYHCLGKSNCNLQSLLKYTGEMEDNLNYKYYSESEWRIIYSDAFKKMSSLANFDGIVEGKNFDNQFIEMWKTTC
ncbi:MAG: abortive infection system antitoxin AbiGi family protein [Nanoarchaeota archaeon]